MRILVALASLALVSSAGCAKKPPAQSPANSAIPAGDQTMGGKTPSGASMDDPKPNPSSPNGKKPTSPEDPCAGGQ